MDAFPTPPAADERHHPIGDEQFWNESWYFDWAARDASHGGYVRIGLYPNLGVCWYWAALVRAGEPLVTIIDHSVPLPAGPSLEIRATGLWADHTCTAPLDQWTVGLEAFGVALDDATGAYAAEPRGAQVPLGFDLDWSTDGVVYQHPPPVTRYEVPCLVHGEVLVGDARLEVDAVGQRDHSWGVRDFWAIDHLWFAVWLDDGTHVHGTTPRPEGIDWRAGYVQAPGAEPVEVGSIVVFGDEVDTSGQFGSMKVTVDVVALHFEPVAFAPVPLRGPAGQFARFPRALVKVQAADGRRGVGWVERNEVVSRG